MSMKKNDRTNIINRDKYIEVTEDMVRKNIFEENKCLTLDYGYRHECVIKSFVKEGDKKEYVYVRIEDSPTAKYQFKDILIQKMAINDLAYWVHEKEGYYDISANFVAPF